MKILSMASDYKFMRDLIAFRRRGRQLWREGGGDR